MNRSETPDISVATERIASELIGERLEAFDDDDVPMIIRPLIPLARYLGVADDRLREKRVARLSSSTRSLVRLILRTFDDDLDEWLAGKESYGPTFSDAYVAFSALRMATD
jgi:hypothetical protein